MKRTPFSLGLGLLVYLLLTWAQPDGPPRQPPRARRIYLYAAQDRYTDDEAERSGGRGLFYSDRNGNERLDAAERIDAYCKNRPSGRNAAAKGRDGHGFGPDPGRRSLDRRKNPRTARW
jgi:hypothetical protein